MLTTPPKSTLQVAVCLKFSDTTHCPPIALRLSYRPSTAFSPVQFSLPFQGRSSQTGWPSARFSMIHKKIHRLKYFLVIFILFLFHIKVEKKLKYYLRIPNCKIQPTEPKHHCCIHKNAKDDDVPHFQYIHLLNSRLLMAEILPIRRKTMYNQWTCYTHSSVIWSNNGIENWKKLVGTEVRVISALYGHLVVEKSNISSCHTLKIILITKKVVYKSYINR